MRLSAMNQRALHEPSNPSHRAYQAYSPYQA
jgi:hypothetical protein